MVERKRIAQTREQSSSDKLPIRSYVNVNSGWAESRRCRTETGTVSGLETVDRRPALRKRPTESLSRPKEQWAKCCLTCIKLPLFESCLNSQLTTTPQHRKWPFKILHCRSFLAARLNAERTTLKIRVSPPKMGSRQCIRFGGQKRRCRDRGSLKKNILHFLFFVNTGHSSHNTWARICAHTPPMVMDTGQNLQPGQVLVTSWPLGVVSSLAETHKSWPMGTEFVSVELKKETWVDWE